MPEREERPGWRRLSELPRHVVVWLIRAYQYCLSPLLGQHCRFHPTCSQYAIEALQRFGAIRGGGMFMRRLLRCHPWCSGGVDLVPAERNDTLQSGRDTARC